VRDLEERTAVSALTASATEIRRVTYEEERVSSVFGMRGMDI